MLHEILLCLGGHFGGDIFNNSFELKASTATHLHPAETDAINKLTKIGLIYSTIKLKTESVTIETPIYSRVVLDSINVLLDEYVHAIILFERRILNHADHDTQYGKTSLTMIVYHFQKVFFFIMSFILCSTSIYFLKYLDFLIFAKTTKNKHMDQRL